MFYRRKIILALLQLFDGRLEKIRLQKLLMLFCERQVKADYDFIPYKFGCYSYSASADLTAMVRNGQLKEETANFSRTDTTDYLKRLKESEKKILIEVKNAYGKMSSNALMKHTYLNFPFYAINSIKASDLLTKEELERINKSKPKSNKIILFTIGYEGISLEEYLNRLIKNDVKVLVDVRNNPLSMKFGFSKSQLEKYCASIGIKYIHYPEVGIQSEYRQELNTQNDYKKLFSIYRKQNLTKTKLTQEKILTLLKEYKRIALTCFESDICQCHRKHLAESIAKLQGFQYEIKHI